MQRYHLSSHWARYTARAGLRIALVGSMVPVLVAGCESAGLLANPDESDGDDPLANAD